MAETVVLYASAEHLNSMLVLSTFIAKHHPSLPITILSFAPDSAAASVSAVPSITYRCLPAVAPPPGSIRNPLEAFFEIPRLNNPNLRAALEEIQQKSRVRALVIDFFCNSAFEVATSLDIPTYFYVSTGGVGVTVFLYVPTVDETVAPDIADLNDYLDIPGCPTIHSLDLPRIMSVRSSNVFKHVLDTARNMRKSSGILTNGFDAIEFRTKEALINGLCVPDAPTPPVYFIGPLVAETAAKNSGAEHECLRWLDRQPSKSVIFLCFGRRGLHSGEQLREMAVGLERSGYRFLWSVRNPPEKNSPATDPDLDEILPEGFLQRTEGRGFVVKSWAPQKEVLSHDAVAGFVTHCGRSSVLEAVVNGVPMIGWPMYAEQRMNRVFVVEEMKASLPLEEGEGGFVTAAEVERRVRELMESKTGRDIRHRLAEMKASAAAAVREKGSSVVDLQKFVDSVTC